MDDGGGIDKVKANQHPARTHQCLLRGGSASGKVENCCKWASSLQFVFQSTISPPIQGTKQKFDHIELEMKELPS